MTRVGKRLGLAVVALSLGAYRSLTPQTTTCPQYQQMVATNGIVDKGMANNAQISIELVDNAISDWNDTQIQAVQTAVSNITSVSGSQQKATVTNVDAADDPSTGTGAAPLVAIFPSAQNIIDIYCPPQTVNGVVTHNSACTTAQWSTTATVSATIYVLPSAMGSTLEQFTMHELGAHADFGWQDCTGDNCTNSISNNTITSSSPTGLTNCDTTQAVACKR